MIKNKIRKDLLFIIIREGFYCGNKALKALKKCDKIFFGKNVLLGVTSTSVYNESDR